MPFFEGKQTLYHILCFVLLPCIVCTLFYFLKPKRIWIAPVFILGLFLIVSAVFYPYFFTDILGGDLDFTTVYWLIFVTPVQIVSALFFTFITHRLIRWKRESE